MKFDETKDEKIKYKKFANSCVHVKLYFSTNKWFVALFLYI